VPGVYTAQAVSLVLAGAVRGMVQMTAD